MKLGITHQDRYSRGELILRTLFGVLYIHIPHLFLIAFVSIWSAILTFLAFWVVLFTGKYPRGWFDFQIGLQNWSLRVIAVGGNLVDGYPSFGVKGSSDKVKLEVEYPEKISRGLVLLRLFFGVIYVGIPHGLCLAVRGIGAAVLGFLAWWAVLFTGRYPERWHGFVVGTYRWSMRIQMYLGFFTDKYPAFSGKE